ncbi:MAG: hypothetical protein HC881_13190 [Leptolyngbyaceae cyanobacterium SL_7_1]|nr:hypothetical protein [Leptolyngbyaceae cyanobacterium SL_7_1]
MQISVERSGGLMGALLTTTLDTSTLAATDAAQLRQLVEAADFFHLPATIPTAAQPDRFRYTITVRQGDRHHTVTVGESTLPSTLRPLLDWLSEMGRK